MKGSVKIILPAADIGHAIELRDRINGMIIHTHEPAAYVGDSGVVINTTEPARVAKDLEEEGFV
jgi:hypothetical protein